MRHRSRRQSLLFVGGVLGLLILSFFVARFFLSSSQEGKKASSIAPLDQEAERFFNEYWRRPIALQGSPPTNYTEKEASLRPEACGSCHPRQYADWKESLHSRAMGPGPWGQIIDLARTSPDGASLCMTCHAPLSEQMSLIAKSTNNKEKTYTKNPYFDAKLQLQGITCAACHVRQHRRFGPIKGEESSAPEYSAGTPDHGGVQRTPYFEKAEFCKGCHQFDPENSLLVNGKPLQDTFREWQNSIWGKGGASCQECHMSQRRHLWKGIHDREWVKDGVRIEAQIQTPSSRPGDALELTLEVVNAAAGHKFPTYITPKIFVRAALQDGSGKTLPGTEREKIIGWDARFEDGKWKEYLDTRIPPGGQWQETFRWKLPPEGKKIRAWVEVHPDHFYHVHFYPAFLKNQELSSQARKLIEKALQDSGRSAYTLFDKILLLPES